MADLPKEVWPRQWPEIWRAGCEHVARIKADPSKPWAKHVDAEHIMQQIKSGEVHAVIFNDTYLVVFNIGVPWTSPGVTMFEELLLLRLYPERESVSYRTVVRGIEQLARANGCAGVMLGAAGAYDDRLGRVIERLGYVKAGGSYYKEL